MADANAPPTAEELVALADSISQEISQSLSDQTRTLADTLTQVRESISDVSALLTSLDDAIRELMNRGTTSADEKRRLEEEIEQLKQSRVQVRDALNRLKATYDEGLAGLQQAAQTYPGVIETNNREVKDRMNELLARVRTALAPGNAGPPPPPPANGQGAPVQGGSRHRRGRRGRGSIRRHTKKSGGAGRRHTRRAHKGGYVWKRRSAASSRRRHRSRSRK